MNLNKTLVSLLILSFPMWAFAQFSDYFEDGNFTSNPAWTGNDANFIVNSSNQLQLNASAAGQSALYTSYSSSSLDNKEWNIYVRQLFAGSDNNQGRIYFAASGAPLAYSGSGSAGIEGYFLKLGEGGSADAVRIYRDNGIDNPVEIASCTAGAISASFTIRIKITRTSTADWTVSIDYSGGNAFVQETTFNDNTFNTSSHFGVICTYTASNINKFYYDDLYFGDIIVDTTPPQVVSVTPTSVTNIDVLFNEPVASSATINSNYSITGGANPSSVTVDGANALLYHLTFATAFPSNTDLEITISNISDTQGNDMPAATLPFNFFIPATPNFRSVVFNEILADPSPTVGLPEVEFVELHNPTNEAYNLTDWLFVNTTTIKTLPSYTLAPGGYVVVCDANNVGLFESAIGIASFTALSNAGDSLTLLDNTGALIDYVAYQDAWFATTEKKDGGWTLELINPLFPCQSAANWQESQNPIGGTPNAINSVYNDTPDVTAPIIVSAFPSGETTIAVSFNETMNGEPVNVADIAISPSVTIASIQWNSTNTGITIYLSESLEVGQTFELLLFNFADCSGNELLENQFAFTIGFQPEAGDLIITEIMAAPSSTIGDYRAEYLEIYNKTDKLLDISELTINSGSFPSQVIIEPFSYLTIANQTNADQLQNISPIAFMTSFPGLTNSGTTLTLAHPAAGTLDVVTYSDTWYRDAVKDNGGWSLELINIEDPCSFADNWIASNNPSGGTPSAQNSVYDDTPDTQAPVLIRVLSGPLNFVTLEFDEPLGTDVISNFGWTLNGNSNTPLSVSFLNGSASTLLVTTNQLQAGQVYNFVLQNISDCWGNTSNSITGFYAGAEEAQPGDLVINEVLSNPKDGGTDFVEIYNNSPRIISLSNWTIGNESGGVPGNPVLIIEGGLLLMPNEYIVLTVNGSELPSFYPFTKTEKIWRMTSMPSYNNDDGVVILYNPSGEVEDRFAYTVDLHFPILESTDGVSLERIDPSRPTDDASNWNSAAENQGFATPGYQNSQAMAAILGDQDIIIEPEIFSPDNDGYQDVLSIKYQNATPGLVANIYIFDSAGRQVRHLTKNEYLGVNGIISWNGTTEDNLLAPVGIYIIYFEVFGANGEVSKIKKTCVLAHPLD
ncbi:MAG: lamin tail domain-containing protein [Flavobacteriales bacterium]